MRPADAGIGMFTGYFGRNSRYIALGYTPVSIALYTPTWFNGFRYPKLAPKEGFFKEWKYGSRKGDNKYYIERFNEEVLKPICQRGVAIRELEALTHAPHSKIVLLCYEKPGDFCHRHLVADWFGKEWCKELNLEKPK